MTKSELIKAVSGNTKITQIQVSKVLDNILSEISLSLVKGEEVQLNQFGIFCTRMRSARAGRDIRSNKAITIPARTAPIFRPSSVLKKLVNEKSK